MFNGCTGLSQDYLQLNEKFEQIKGKKNNNLY